LGHMAAERITQSTVAITTNDGVCPSYVFRPNGKGPWPGVLLYMDGIGIRPAVLAVGQRLALYGYLVLLPDLFYRSGPYEPMNAKTVFSDPEQRKTLMEKFFALAPLPKIMDDTRFFIEWLERSPDVIKKGIGTTGYCMGGGASFSAAGTYPGKIRAAAAFHPGRLATDAPESPHRLAPNIEARVYIAGAMDDSSFPDDMKQRLDRALADAGVNYTLETYPARHGWVLRDTPAYDAEAEERHWKELVSLLDETLKPRATI
jgi:carboxymethylenebutenolidase